jgi:hypothetical protein
MCILPSFTKEYVEMGGVNHQPCNRQGTNYLVISTKLSRAFTKGRSLFETGNVHLEDVILSELEHQRPNPNDFNQILGNLDAAVIELGGALKLLDELESEMQVKGYEPLPSFALYAKRSDALQLCVDLAAAGLGEFEALKPVVHPQLDGKGFYGALPVLRAEIERTKQMVTVLRLLIFSASHLADDGRIANELETNGGRNFRMAFMATYAQWNRCFDLFLASAAWSSEMWYQSMGYGSMTRNIERQRMAG